MLDDEHRTHPSAIDGGRAFEGHPDALAFVVGDHGAASAVIVIVQEVIRDVERLGQSPCHELIASIAGDDHGPSGVVIPHSERKRVRVPLERSPTVDGGPVSAVLLIEHTAGAGHVQRIEPGPSLMKTLLPFIPAGARSAPDARAVPGLPPP